MTTLQRLAFVFFVIFGGSSLFSQCVDCADSQHYVHVRIRRIGVGGCSGGDQFNCRLCASQPLDIILDTCVYEIDIMPSDVTVEIGQMVFRGSAAPGDMNAVNINIYPDGGTLNAYPLAPVKAGRNWQGLFIPDHRSMRLYGGINGDLTSDVYVDVLDRFDVGGQIRANLTSNGTHADGAIVHAGAINSSGGVAVLQWGFVREVQTTVDGLNGGISAPRIGSVIVAGNLTGTVRTSSSAVGQGTIGSLQVTGMITDNYMSGQYPIRAYRGIGRITAGSIQNAHIIANADQIMNVPAVINTLVTTSGGFSGDLQAEGIVAGPQGSQGIQIAGDFSGTMSLRGTGIQSPVVIQGSVLSTSASTFNIDSIGVLPSSASIKIGGSLLGNIWIGHAPVSSLLGQVIIGANGTGSSIWAGAIKEDGVTLSPQEASPNMAPYYAQSSAQLGGGAVGLVPYHLYNTDCSPAQTSPDNWDTSVPTDTSQQLLNSRFSHRSAIPTSHRKSVRMRFYGPIACNTAHPVSVWLWLHHTQWLEVTDWCSINHVNGREIEIYGDGTRLLPSGYYAVLAQTSGPNRLFCQGTLAAPGAEPSVMWNATDADGNHVVQMNFYLLSDCNENDILDDASQYCGPCIADYFDADLDRRHHPDGGVTIDDLLSYLEDFQAGDPFADVDDGTGTGTPDGGVTVDDLLYFLDHFERGC